MKQAQQGRRRLDPVLTPWTDSTRATGGGLADGVLQGISRRLSILSVVAGTLWAISLVLNNWFPPGFGGMTAFAFPWPGNLVGALGVALAVGMWTFLRFGRADTAILDVGLVFLVVNAFGIGLLDEWGGRDVRVRSVSWIALVILVYAMNAPSTPRKTLVAALVAASMDPLHALFAHLRGVSVPPAVEVMVQYWPNYAAALLAVVPAQVLERLSRQVQRAREAGSYELVEALGHGGMGEVWRAEHRLLARPAAVKIIQPRVLGAASEAAVDVITRRFMREAQATAVLSSPHTVGLYDFGVTDQGSFYYVMELLNGRDLESFVREFGPLPVNRAVHLLRQVCHSLAEAHSRSLVHRDVKPANIYVCRMGLDYDFIKVLDFGLVKFGEGRSVARTYATSEFVTSGTPGYMAPEVILGGAETDRRADVYALGCVAYWMITGQLVFEADTAMRMFDEHLHAAPVPPSQRTELPIPREVDEVILRCLDKDPARRPRDAAELYGMWCDCGAGGAWTKEAARHWWELHLPELSRPLTLAMPAAPSVSPAQ
jgi:eukaryotic-like serine/threonine-protein kinase